MKVVKFNEVPYVKEEGSPLGIRDYLTTAFANVAIVSINGRYPPVGASKNLDAEMYVVGLSGRATLVSNGERAVIASRDVAVIPAGEEYYYDECKGFSCTLFSTPPFDPDKYINTHNDVNKTS